jgi:hypothetical protein
VIIQFADFTETNVLVPVGITTPPPIVPPVIKYGDHLFYMEPLWSGIPELGAPFWNPDLARVVNIANNRIGTKTGVRDSNSVRFGSNNNVKVG